MFGPPRPPRELARVETGYPLLIPVDGTCPAGTAPAPAAIQCTDVPICACEYVCSPACAIGMVCGPDALDPLAPATCTCHPALEPTPEGCVWPGLLADSGFDDPAAWRLWAVSTSDSAIAELAAGRLELSITQRCAYAWAGSIARLPPRSEFPAGAALVFDYRATGNAADTNARILARLDSLGFDVPLDLSGSPAQFRACAQLRDMPWQTLLELSIEAYGTCAERVPYSFSVDDVRLEADPSCG